MKRCPKCNETVEPGALFCGACGAQIIEETTATENVQPAAVKKEKQPLPKKALLFGGIAAVIVAVAVFIGSAFLGGEEKEYSYAYYVKNNELYAVNYNDGETTQLSSDLLYNETVFTLGHHETSSIIRSYVTANESGTKVFYPDKFDSESEGITLYYRNMNKQKSDPVEVESGIRKYAINSDGSQIIYTKGSNDELYLSDFENAEMLMDYVDDFFVSDDFSKIIYVTESDDLYLWNSADNTNEIFFRNVRSVEYISDDFSTVYCIGKNDRLIVLDMVSAEPTYLASPFYNIIEITDQGEIYYTKETTVNLKIFDYITEEVQAEYYHLEDMCIKDGRYELYYYDGKQNTLISNSLTSGSGDKVFVSNETSTVIFEAYDDSSFEKITLSDISAFSELISLITNSLDDYASYFCCIDSQITPLETSEILTFVPNTDYIYLLAYDSSRQKEDLYKLNVDGDKAGTIELIDQDLAQNMFLYAGSDIAYLKKSLSGTSYDLCVEGEVVDNNIWINDYLINLDSAYYYTNWNKSINYGTLKMLSEGTVSKIADYVSDIAFTPDGKVVYLSDYDEYTGGTMNLFTGQKSIVLDEEVLLIPSQYRNKVMGESYFAWYW